MNSSTIVSIIHPTNSNGLRRPFQLKKVVQKALQKGIDNDIYSTVDAYPNACEMWKAIERLKQCESINVQDLETNLYLEFGKFTSHDGELLKSYYSRFYKMINELVRNQCDVTNHQQHQNEVNEIRAERLARTANPLALVAQHQPVYHPQNHPIYYTQNSSTRLQQAATRNKGKEIVNSLPPIYDQEPNMVTKDDALSKEKEIDKLMALISLSFKKIYKPTNNNLRFSSNTSRAHQDNTLRINKGTRYDNQRVVNVVGARENVGTQVVQQSGIQCYNCKEYGHVARECQKPKWAKDRDDIDEEPELEAHYLYMAQIQEVTPDAAAILDPSLILSPLQKQPESVNDTYPDEQDEHNIIIDSLDMSHDRERDDQDDDDLTKEHDLLASLIEKLKCEINDSKNRNKFLELSNKILVDKLKGEIENFKTKNKSLESSNNHFKEANNELSNINQLMFKDLKKFQVELNRYHDVNFASKVEIDCAKA
ncbi:gag-pol polyprotein [Tanacetum coccineum]